MTTPLLLNFFCVAYIIGYFQTTYSISFTITDKSANYTHTNVPCPTVKPLTFSNGTHSVCVSSCGPKMVLDGTTCIDVRECTKLVLSGGRCMEQCPDGYLYVDLDNYCFEEPCSYQVKDIGANPCVTKTYLLVWEGCYVSLIILYTVFICMFFSTRQFPLIKLVTRITCIKRTEMPASDGELLINADSTDD